MKKLSNELCVGDCIEMRWCGNKIIKSFKEYTGCFDFVERVAVFYDGTAMSIEKGHVYDVVL